MRLRDIKEMLDYYERDYDKFMFAYRTFDSEFFNKLTPESAKKLADFLLNYFPEHLRSNTWYHYSKKEVR